MNHENFDHDMRNALSAVYTERRNIARALSEMSALMEGPRIFRKLRFGRILTKSLAAIFKLEIQLLRMSRALRELDEYRREKKDEII